MEFIDYLGQFYCALTNKRLPKRCAFILFLEHIIKIPALHKSLLYPDLESKDIDDNKSFRMQTVKPATVNRELSTLRHIFNLAKRWKKFFGDNPVSVSGLLREDNLRKLYH